MNCLSANVLYINILHSNRVFLQQMYFFDHVNDFKNFNLLKNCLTIHNSIYHLCIHKFLKYFHTKLCVYDWCKGNE